MNLTQNLPSTDYNQSKSGFLVKIDQLMGGASSPWDVSTTREFLTFFLDDN